MTDKLKAACIALLKSAPDHITNEHWPELDEIVKALAEPSAQNAINWHHPECEGACLACLIEKLVKKEFGKSGLDYLLKSLNQLTDTTKMIEPVIDKDLAINVGIDALSMFATDKTPEGWAAIDAIGVMRKALTEQHHPVAFYVYEWINPSDGVVFRSFRHDEHHMGRDPDRTIAVPEPHIGIDHGAWADVPDATKWLDELRGER